MATRATFAGGIQGTTSTIGDIRFNVVGADYSGFFRMNGRAAGVLPANAQAGLGTLGLVALPNAQNRKIRQGGALGTLGGNATVTLGQTNMPSGNLVGVTPSGGAHDHPIGNNTNIRNNGANLNPKAKAGPQAPTSNGAITVNNNNNPHDHPTVTMPTGGAGAAFTIPFQLVSVGYYICLDSTVINTWLPINGDVKHAFNNADHNGWILLNGRLKTTLTATQQAVATALGIGANLPNPNGMTIKMKGALYTTGGADSIILSVANLPNINLTATSSSNGTNHPHTLNNGTVRSALNGGTNFNHVTNANRPMPGRTIGIDPGGAHPHNYTIAIGGNDAPISILTPYLTANTFIYLGL